MKTKIPLLFLLPALLPATGCQPGYLGHSGSTRLVIAQPVRIEEGHFSRDFREALEMLTPHECHDSTFIQDRVFLERIDLASPCEREFTIAPNLVRDFFGSNNPEKKRVLREEILFFGDSAFEKRPDMRFLAESMLTAAAVQGRIVRYLAERRTHPLLYLYSPDTLAGFETPDSRRQEVHHDLARLNCRIVNDLARLGRREAAAAEVVVMVLPESHDTGSAAVGGDIFERDPGKVVPGKPAGGGMPAGRRSAASREKCPPDSVAARFNRERREVIHEFRNLLHCVATTRDDAELKRKFREEAARTLRRIPAVTVEGIPAGGLEGFLASDFPARVAVAPLYDECRIICGVRIGNQ